MRTYYTCALVSLRAPSFLGLTASPRLYQIYFASFAQFVAAMSPNSASASILFSTFFSFVIVVRSFLRRRRRR